VFALLAIAGCGSNADKTSKPAIPPPTPAAPKQAAPEMPVPQPPTQEESPKPTKPGAAAAPKANESATPGPTLVAPANEPKNEPAAPDDKGPQGRTAFFRADAAPAAIPPVPLSHGHNELCKVLVDDAMPAIKLPQLDGKADIQLADKFGEKATVVVFWKSDRRMARQELADLGPDVIEPFGKNGVAVIGIVVNEKAETAQAALKKAAAEFTNLLDADGKAFAQIGKERLPRTFLLDPKGKILWFDIEYSPATRRELHQALRAVIGDQGAAATDKPTLSEAAPAGDPASAGGKVK
jgi:peroxiredoxin